MKTLKTLAFFVICFAVFSGCDSRSVGGDNNNVNNNQQEEYLTRGQAITDIVSMVMPEALDQNIACQSPYPDVENNSDLCRSISLLERRDGGSLADPSGLFRPEDNVNHAETWKLIVKIFGFLPFPSTPCAPDVEEGAWFHQYFSTLCDKNLVMLNQDGLSEPSNSTTLEEWDEQKSLLRDYMLGTVTRLDAIEVLQTVILQDRLDYSASCTGSFLDVLDNSPACYLSNSMLDEGVLDPEQQYFRPGDYAIWDEIVKIYLTAAGIDQASECTGCMASPEIWSCNWMDKLCEIGLNFGFIVSLEQLNRNGLARFSSNLAIYVNEHPL